MKVQKLRNSQKKVQNSHSHILSKLTIKSSRPSLKHYREIEVIETLLSACNMIAVNRKFNLTETSKVSEYLQNRGMTYKEFRLIQFMAGASSSNVEQILARRQHESLEQFSAGRYPFLKQIDQSIENYLDLYTRLSMNENPKVRAFFNKTRFSCALVFSDNLEKTAEILSVSLDEVQEFIRCEHIFTHLLLKPTNTELKKEESQHPGRISITVTSSPKVDEFSTQNETSFQLIKFGVFKNIDEEFTFNDLIDFDDILGVPI